MGGQSFKCPKCKEWYTSKALLRAHLMYEHGEPKGFKIEGVADNTRIERGVYTQVDPQ